MHRVVGFTGFNLMLAHIVLITWGYAVRLARRGAGTFWTLMWQDPGMLLAVAGRSACSLVVGTSIRARADGSGTSPGNLLHLYAYLGVGLALPHRQWDRPRVPAPRAPSSGGPRGRGGRLRPHLAVALPLWRSARHQLKVTSVVAEAPGIASVYMSGRALHRMPVEAASSSPGASWQAGWSLRQPVFSCRLPPTDAACASPSRTSATAAETCTGSPGTRVVVEGPWLADERPRPDPAPRGVHRRRRRHMAPLRALAEEISYAPATPSTWSGTATPLFAREVDQLCHERGLQVVHLLVTDVPDWSAAARCRPVLRPRHCGAGSPSHRPPRRLMSAGPRGPTWSPVTCLASGLPPEQLHVETFAW